jgi:hypothetical protein
MHDPRVALMVGIIFLLWAVLGMRTGKMFSRRGMPTTRSEDPKMFWLLVAVSFLVGVSSIGYYLHRVL